MKKEIKKSILFVAMMVSMSGVAKEHSRFSILKTEPINEIPIKDVKKGQKLIIKDSYGSILYKELIQESGSYKNKGFDLTQLPDGNYFIELEKDLQIRIIPFNVSLNQVEFSKENEASFFKPYVRSKENKLFLTKLSLEKFPFSIAIYYDALGGSTSYDKIYFEKIENTQVIEKIYTLDKEKKGTYKIVMKSDGREFTKIVTM